MTKIDNDKALNCFCPIYVVLYMSYAGGTEKLSKLFQGKSILAGSFMKVIFKILVFATIINFKAL